ncbi:MAG: asparaginase domain-containing protein [Halanaerobiales bacterium]|nr:asparaginase domain-containing protein [Halanaerobiales bacterium]
MDKLLFIATGGTISSSESEEGLTPSFDAEQLLSYTPEVKDFCNIEGTLLMNIDSSNMRPALVKKIAKTIYDNYEDYDGFVITHGTDTMGYTPALLTYMLPNIKKPVIMTGSQIAMGQLYTDARLRGLRSVSFFLWA